MYELFYSIVKDQTLFLDRAKSIIYEYKNESTPGLSWSKRVIVQGLGCFL